MPMVVPNLHRSMLLQSKCSICSIILMMFVLKIVTRKVL